MITYDFLQHYWWFLIALLGGLLVFLLFVQGGNALIFLTGREEDERQLIVNSTGRKWELTFTTLVTFGGAFFASFPLFYSTSFSGAYWVWILILITFVFQAVSYEFQSKTGNLLGKNTFRVFLTLNGCLAPLLIGTAVGTFFTGSDFTINKSAVGDIASPVISRWGNAWHGLEAVANPFNVEFGLMVMFLAIALGALYLMNNVDHAKLAVQLRRSLGVSFGLFLLFFLVICYHLITMEGFAVDASGTVTLEEGKYFTAACGRRSAGCGSCHDPAWQGVQTGYLAGRPGHDFGRDGPLYGRGLQPYGLLPLDGRPRLVAHACEQLVERLHAAHDGRRLADHTLRRGLHRLLLAPDGQAILNHRRTQSKRKVLILARTKK